MKKKSSLQCCLRFHRHVRLDQSQRIIGNNSDMEDRSIARLVETREGLSRLDVLHLSSEQPPSLAVVRVRGSIDAEIVRERLAFEVGFEYVEEARAEGSGVS